MLRLCFRVTAAPKKTRRTVEQGLRPTIPFGSNTFWLHPPPLEQKRHFSKAGLATLGDLHFNPNFKIFRQK
jgi:hypothetical protein